MNHHNVRIALLVIWLVLGAAVDRAAANTFFAHQQTDGSGQCVEVIRIVYSKGGRCLQDVWQYPCGSSQGRMVASGEETLAYECFAPAPGETELPARWDAAAGAWLVAWPGHGGLWIDEGNGAAHIRADGGEILRVPDVSVVE